MPDNQTKEEWLELAIVADNPNATGTGGDPITRRQQKLHA
jgi:hypothetical protein